MILCVANTSPMVALSCVGRLDLLRGMVPRILVPDAVYDEVVGKPAAGWVAAEQLRRELVAGTWLVRTPVPPLPLVRQLRSRLGGSGESEAIALAADRRLPVLLDELAGRQAAVSLGLEVFGSLRVLREAKNAGRLERVRPLLVQMTERGIYFHDELVERFLRELGEP